MTKVIMHGCNGKMGQVITGLIAQDEDVKIVAGIDTYDEKKNDYYFITLHPVNYVVEGKPPILRKVG